MTTIVDELSWRGLIHASTEGVSEFLSRESVTVYNGYDATADSLHVGNLVTMLALARLQRFGHTPIAVVGGGTTMIGDPGGKSQERPLLLREQIEANVEGIQAQLARVLDFKARSNPARLLNNADWLLPMSAMTLLRDIGKHITVNYMLAKDSVKSRLESDTGISFTEFSYMLLQGYDFLYLFEQYNCRLQTGGGDQWGNITTGVEFIRRVRGQQAYGMVYPLILKADGTKFGKSETGTVWLDARRTSPYRFYQFWLNTEDQMVIPYLKYFTWLSQPEIQQLQAALAERPEKREAQHALAREVTQMMHGETALAKAEQASQALFGGEITGLSALEIKDIFAEVPSSEVPSAELSGPGLPLLDLLTRTGLATSRGDARRSIEGGGIYLNNRQAPEVDRQVTWADSIDGQFMVLRKGRKNYHLVRIRREA